MSHRVLIGGLAVLSAAALWLAPVVAQERSPTPAGPIDAFELEAFIDGVMAATLDAYHIAGGAVTVVQDGRPILAKGYAYADLDRRTPVSASETLFRIGSVSKLFVWTAVMQLVDEGRLDLNADVNRYLTAFKVPMTYPEPVTLKHLMSHSPGFEDRVIHLFARDASSLRPLGQILAEELPERVRPPGQVSSYSNHGTGLAAYIVERVSGMAWDDYVERRILEPLAMARTTFRQPIPPTVAARLSKGYRFTGGELREEPFEYVPLAPVGAASTTATDVANFMIAHLQLGRFGVARILQDATARTMQGELFRHASAVNPMAHGFIDMSMNGQRVIGHGGDTHWFHTELALLPEHNLGFFVAFNSDGGGRATGRVYREFMRHYFPAGEAPVLTPPTDANRRLARFAGVYRPARYSHSDFTKVAAAVRTLRIVVTPEGELQTLGGEEATRWIETSPLAFRERQGLRTLAFGQDARGRITHLFVGDLPVIAFERVGPSDLPMVQLLLLLTTLAIFVTTIVFWPAAALVRRHFYVTLPEGARVPRVARSLGWLGSLGFVSLAAGLIAVLDDPNQVVFGVPMMVRISAVVGLAAGVLAAGAGVATGWIWWRGRGSVWGRVAYTLVTLALIAATWQAWHWNLLGLL